MVSVTRWMETRRNDNVRISPANVDAVAGPIRCRLHFRIIGPFVNQLIAPGCNVAQPLRDRPIFIFELLHRGGIVHIDSEETGLRTGNRSPIAIAEFPAPRLNLLQIGRGAVLPAG
jgi:hypothetical protein